MDTINVYTAEELKEKFPQGFENALSHWQNNQDEIFWQDEIMDSLKAVFKKAGIHLNDWSISDSSPSYVRFAMDEEGEITGQKAYRWIKENILDGATFRRVTYSKKHGGKGWRYDIFKADGNYWQGLTGYCADNDFVESLLDDIRGGCTIKDALNNLADCAGHLFEQELENQRSEEFFLDHASANEYKFLENGTQI